MSDFDWKGTIGQFAPVVAGMLGSPAAGVVVGGLCSVLGLSPSPENAQKVAEQVAAGTLTGDQLVALRRLESESKAQLAKMGMDYDIQKDELVFKDRDSARSREIAVKDWTPRILAYGVVISWACINGYLLKHAMDGSALRSDMAQMIGRILGTLDAALTFVLGYYFGSSAASSRKDELLQQSIPASGAQP